MVIKGHAQALGRSWLLSRLRPAATVPLTEQQVLDRLKAAAHDIGCASPDVVTAIFVGMKLGLRVCVGSQPHDRSARLLTTIAATLVGADSQQTLYLPGPVGDDPMAQRFAAVRLAEFVGMALEPTARSRAWFIVIETPGDPTTTVRWVAREIEVTARAHGLPPRLPANLNLLIAAGALPPVLPRGWVALQAPRWQEGPHALDTKLLPPVGYQRLVVEARLTAVDYRVRVQQYAELIRQSRPSVPAGWPRQLMQRWCAASVDEHGAGLWRSTSAEMNFRAAMRVLALLDGP